ncbi:hypothetical protein HDU86_005212 [Geranomyces michiganensis]|nr:hypothetical protein HDU86_005212 [Geranomyces michiganensis]
MTTTKTAEEGERQQKGIAELGTYMLKGWVLTDVLCPNPGCNIPVVRKRDRSAQICVLCDDPDHPWLPVQRETGAATSEVATTENAATAERARPLSEPVILTAEEEAELEATLQDDVSASQHTAEFEERRQQGDRASKLLGQKMLQGWTLLDELCKTPSCIGIPLVRNRQKQTFCVICEGNGAVVESPAKASAPTAAAAPVLPCAVVPARAIATESDSAKRRKLAPASASTTANSTSRASTAVTIPAATTASGDLAAQVDATVTTLIGKLEELRQLAADASLPENTRSACDAIASCAGAIAALQAIRQ